MSIRGGVSVIALLLTLAGSGARAEVLPDDSGVINVRTFGATGNGHDDDTAALLRAIAASGQDTGPAFWQDRIVYLPRGTYLVSGTLLKRYANGQFASGLILVGESPTNTIIQLADHTPGFGDAEHNRAVIFTTSKLLSGSPTAGGKDYSRLGEGNDAYMNFIENLTIDVGKDNAGAIGIDFLGNNVDAIRNITLRAPAGSGSIGLSMTRKWPGPSLIQDLTVQGFDVGIAAGQTEYGLTFDHIDLSGQRVLPIRNDQNSLAIYDLHISGPSPLIRNIGDKGFLAIDDALLKVVGGPSELTSAVDNAGVIVARNIKIESEQEGRHRIAGPLNGVLTGHAQWHVGSNEAWLPSVASSPVAPTVEAKHWTNAAKFGPTGEAVDSTETLRRALESGASVIYLPHGIYAISDTLEIPNSVLRIVGMNSTLHVNTERLASFPNSKPMIRVGSGGAPLSIEKLHFDHTNLGTKVAIEISGSRDVTVRDAVSAGMTIIDRKPTGGRVFLENSCCGPLRTSGPQPIFARQFDTEGSGVRISNFGSPLWILGLKTEGVATILDNRQGGHTDIFGGLVYMVRDGADASVPAFKSDASWLSAAFVEESLRSGSRYSIYVDQGSPDGSKSIGVDEFPTRGYGRFVPNLTVTPAHQGGE